MKAWRSPWISNPLFGEHPPLDLLHKANIKPEFPEHPSHLQNLHTYFRKTFSMEAAPRSVRLKITADDIYRLFINGKLVGEGPASGYVFEYPYDEYDVSDFLINGENVIAVDVYYQGLVNRVFCSGDYRQGMSLELSLDHNLIASDASWKMTTMTADKGKRTAGYFTQFLEDIDGRLLPVGWTQAGFDDSSWQTPLVKSAEEAGYHIVPSGIDPLEVKKVFPKEIRKISDQRYFVDFGEEIVGSVGMLAHGTPGHIMEFKCGEELTPEGAVRFQMRCNCEYFDTWTLAGGSEEIQFFDYKSFRYLEISNTPCEVSKSDVWVLSRHTPFHQRAEFQSSSRDLDAIWKICVHSVKCATQGAMLDCASREKGQYLGDAIVTSLSHMYSQGDPRVTKKVILDFARSARICPGLMAVAPGNFMQEIADFSLLWPMMLREYYEFSGDKALVTELVPVIEGLLAYFKRYENDSGLLERVDEKWNLVDWPENLRDGYDYKRAENGVNTVLNAFYQGCLLQSSELLRIAGKDSAALALDLTARNHRNAFNRLLLNPDTGLYVDALGSTHSSLHANTLPLLFAMPENNRPIIDLVRRKKFACGVFMAFFVLRALIAHDEHDLAYEMMTSHDLHSWHTMLKAGATTCMEAWGPDLKWNTSWCHPWASAPVSLIPQFFMGIKPSTPGWETLDFSPRTPPSLASASFSLQISKGLIASRHEWKSSHVLEYSLETPVDMPVLVRLPVRAGIKSVLVNGKDAAGHLSDRWWKMAEPLSGGKISLSCTYHNA